MFKKMLLGTMLAGSLLMGGAGAANADPSVGVYYQASPNLGIQLQLGPAPVVAPLVAAPCPYPYAYTTPVAVVQPAYPYYYNWQDHRLVRYHVDDHRDHRFDRR